MSVGLQVWSQTAASNNIVDTAVNWQEGQAPSTVNDSARAMMASLAKWRDDINGTLATTGSSVAYTLSSNQVQSALTAGYMIAAQFHATCDTSATLAVDSLSAKPIQIRPGVNISFGQIRAGSIKRFTYSSTGSGQWILHGAPDAIPGDIVHASRAAAGADELAADGAPYSRTTYADLFAAIGTTFGSSDSSTFQVPKIAGRVIAGKEASATLLTTAVAGFSGATLGAAGGDQNVQAYTPAGTIVSSASGGSIQVTASESPGSANMVSATYVSVAPSNYALNVDPTVSSVFSGTPAGSGASQNVQPTIVLNAFIKI